MPTPEYIDIYAAADSQASQEACTIPTGGVDGVGIASISQIDSTHFMITLTNGVQYTLTMPVGPTGATGATGATGSAGATGAAGTNGTNGTNGSNGAAGAAGTNGTNGTNGANGLNIYQIAGVPSSGLGSNGEAAVDYTTFNYYTKVSGSWVLRGNLQPASGAAGGDLAGTYPNPTVNTINGVTKNYYDPTSSIQTQLNSKLTLTSVNTLRTSANFGQTVSEADVGHYLDPGTGDNTYTVKGWISLKAASGQTLVMQVTFTYGGFSWTKTFFPQGTTSGVLSSVDFYPMPPMNFRVTSGTNIQVSTTVSGSGSILYESGCSIVVDK